MFLVRVIYNILGERKLFKIIWQKMQMIQLCDWILVQGSVL